MSKKWDNDTYLSPSIINHLKIGLKREIYQDREIILIRLFRHVTIEKVITI